MNAARRRQGGYAELAVDAISLGRDQVSLDLDR